MTMQDVRGELLEDFAYKQKFVAIHYLSWNVSKKLNIGLFETVIWDNANDRGFDVNFVNIANYFADKSQLIIVQDYVLKYSGS